MKCYIMHNAAFHQDLHSLLCQDRSLKKDNFLVENQMCNFAKGRHEEHSCNFYLHLDQRFRSRHHLKVFLI